MVEDLFCDTAKWKTLCLPVWLHNSHGVTTVFYYFIGPLFYTLWISNRNRLPFCFVLTKAVDNGEQEIIRWDYVGMYLKKKTDAYLKMHCSEDDMIRRCHKNKKLKTIVHCYFCWPHHFYTAMYSTHAAIYDRKITKWNINAKLSFQSLLFWGITIAVQESITLTAPTGVQKPACRTKLSLLWVSCLKMWPAIGATEIWACAMEDIVFEVQIYFISITKFGK